MDIYVLFDIGLDTPTFRNYYEYPRKNKFTKKIFLVLDGRQYSLTPSKASRKSGSGAISSYSRIQSSSAIWQMMSI